MSPVGRPWSRALLVCLLLLAGVGWLRAAEAVQLTLNWTDNSDNEDGFAVERKTGVGGTFSPLATTAPNVTTYVDATVVADGSTYCYRVRAFNAFGNSAYTSEACGTPAQTLTVSRAGSGSGTVTSSPAGINCGATCAAAFASGTAVTLTAAPAAGSSFTGWSGGGCTGTGTCTVTLTANTTVTATFVTASPPVAPGNLTVQ